jgi:group I intron endonuclease
MNSSCIYKVTNTQNSKAYIGKTKNGVAKRMKDHRGNTRKGSQLVFHQAIRKYGFESFKVEVLEETTEDRLNEREKFWIAVLKPAYNMTEGGDGGISMSQRIWITNGIVNKRILPNMPIPEGFILGMNTTGQKRSDEAKANMAAAKIGSTIPAHVKAKMSASQKARHFAE